MSITINGSGTITGISAGGLPDGCVTSDDLATSISLGKILQVVTDEYTGTASTTSQDTYGDIASDYKVLITPSATSSKIFVIVTIGRAGVNHTGGRLIPFRVLRDSTAIGVGPAAGSRMQGSFTIHTTEQGYSDGTTWTYLDSPSSTSELTYKVQWADQAGEGSFINRSSGDGDNGDTPNTRTMSTITVMEVAG